MNSLLDVIRRPLVTEKSVQSKEELGCYTFEVASDASKPRIRQAVELLFKVDVKNVRTMMTRGKVRRIGRHEGRRSNWKKAVVTLAKGQKIEQFEVKP